MSIMDTIRSNMGKVAFGSAGTIITIVGTLFTLDARYAHAADAEKDKAQTRQIIQETTTTLRKQMLEDKLFELDAKQAAARDGKLPPVEKAMKERYERQLRDIGANERAERVAADKADKK